MTVQSGATPAATSHPSASSVQAMRDFDISAPLPQGTVLLEASAGTGKTWTIAALVARYVAEGVATLTEMLIVTFGRAASQELRARVREQLVCVEVGLAEAVAAAQEHERPRAPVDLTDADPLLRLLLDAGPEELRLRHRRIRAALTHFDAATIATTHQFCQQVLRSLGVAGATDAGATLVENLDDLLVDVVDDIYLRGFIHDGTPPVFTRKEALAIARAAVSDVHAELRPTAAESGSVADRRRKFTEAVRAEMSLRKRRKQVLHYNDLLTQLAEALEPADSPARVRMRQRWRVVLVDEFQDTDPIQWQVLDRAFTGHAHAMVLIGDPKQAIYAFRGGDIVTYLQAARTATDRRTLPRNYRSDPALVRSLAILLGGAELGDEDITVHRVMPDRQRERLLEDAGAEAQPLPPIRLRQVLKTEHLRDRTTVGPVRAHIASDLAHDIAALLASGAHFDGRRIQARDVAVLAHRGRDLLDAQAALHGLGIPAVSAGGSGVLESRAAQDWLALLEAMTAPHRSALTRAAALTDLLGYSVADLDARTRDGQVDDELAQQCRDLAAVYSRQGIAAVLEVLTAQGLASRVLGQVGGERSLTDLRHIAQILHDVSRQEDPGLVSLLGWLRSAMAEDAAPGTGTRTRRLDSDAAAVQLVTIHGSKGLQYPVVYLPSLADRHVRDTPSIPLYHEPEPERTRCLDVGGQDANPTWAEAVSAYKDEDAGESLRLLYVALTRAQSQAVVWWSPNNNAPHSPLHRMLFGREPNAPGVPDKATVPADDATATTRLRAWEATGAFRLERADIAAEVAELASSSPPPLAVSPWSRTIDEAWRRTSYTALSSPAESASQVTAHVTSEPEVTPRADEPDVAELVRPETPGLPGLELPIPGADTPSPMADLPVGATFGSLVHAVLEHADPHAADLREELLTHVREQLVEWPVDLDPELLADALVAVCDTPLGPLADGATLRQIGLKDRLSELDFELPLSGGDFSAANPTTGPRLGDLATLLHAYLPDKDPVRAWAIALETSPDLADQPLRGYLTGSVDVVLRTGGRYLVVDYKTNWLGSMDEPLTAASYRPEMLGEAMGHSSYPLQALLYAVVAHRFLRWRLPGYDPEEHLGGVLYLYVRGMCGPATPSVDGHPCGVFSWQPPVALVEAVSDLLDGRPQSGEAA